MKSKMHLTNNKLRWAFIATFSIIMLTALQTGWAQNRQSGSGGPASQSQTMANSPKATIALRSASDGPKMNIPQVILTEESTLPRTKAGDNSASTSLVKIKSADGNTVSEPIEWDDAFPKIREEGGSILFYQGVTLTNTDNILPSANCTIDGGGHELHYTENGLEKTLILDADITFKNIKLFDGLVAWGHSVVFESDVTLSDNYSIWGGEFRNENSTVSGKEDYVVENTNITIKGGTFKNIYGGSSDGEITGSTHVVISGGTIAGVYGGNSHSDAEDIPGDTHVTISGGTITGDVYGAGINGAVKGTAYTTISGSAILNNHLFGGGSATNATAKNTQVKVLGGTISGWLFGGGHNGAISEKASVEISGGNLTVIVGGGWSAACNKTELTISGGTFSENIFGGGYLVAATCGNTDMTLSGVSLGNNTWVYGGGVEGSVSGTAKVTVKSGTTINKTVFGGSGGWDVNSYCTNTEVVIEGGQIGWVYGGGEEGIVTETAKVTVKGGTITDVFGGAGGWNTNASCKNTEVVIAGGEIFGVYGGGFKGSVSGTAKVTVEKGTIKASVFGGGADKDNASCGNTEVTIKGGTINYNVFGGGGNGTVTNDTRVTIEGGEVNSGVYGCGQIADATVGGDVNVIAKGGSMQILGAANANGNASISGTLSITIEGGKTTFTGEAPQIMSGNLATGVYKDCTLTFKNCGTDDSPYNIPIVYNVSKVVMNNSFITKDPTGQANPAFMHNSSKPLIIEGTGMKGSFEIQSYGGTVTPAAGTTIATAKGLTTNAAFTTNGNSLYRVAGTYRYPGTNATLHTVKFIKPDEAAGTLTVKWGDTELDSGDQVPAGTQLTVEATTTTAGKVAVIKDGETVVVGGKLTASADINLTVTTVDPEPLDLSKITNDVVIGYDNESKLWHYTDKTITRAIPAGATAFNGTVTGFLTDGKTVQLAATCQGTLTFDNAVINSKTTAAPGLTIDVGAQITIEGTLTVTSENSAHPAILNNGAMTIGNATVTADNTADAGKGISVSNDATLYLKDTHSEMKASGLESEGTVVVKEGASLTDTSNNAPLQDTYTVTITAPGNGNTLTVKTGDIVLATGDKVAENTVISITATAATDYDLTKITVTPEGGTAVTITDNQYTMTTAAITIAAAFSYNPTLTPPTYYTVSLPSVVGATTDPAAGDHEVQEGDSFIFSLTLDAEYAESVPVITADNATVELRSDGKYEIDHVHSDLVISISGIEKNVPTAIENVNNGTKAWSSAGIIYICSTQPQRVQVISLAGSIVRHLDIPAGDTQIEGLASGIYILHFTDGTVSKMRCNKR